eukprot:CAMPEP_0179725690 /NCGR_PEP_ID=MMETSP0938-20121108/6679_1 /TAXON_ID=548131 ORGANISM="Ostreococcus mediterraneus, Strain clade-D-RCC1107" /NCGR_SAMPLE_ID=MMETSP0938 /ASSEMBLY_ACC=CAM_ASM_000576 /LENGTH=102 /DNA_ID=CAMNT_0021599781 /DNA_START=121 /DNA_END=429 /DNA_ORIENTATION=-
MALYGTSRANVGPTPVHIFRTLAPIPPFPPFVLALSRSAPTNARPPLCPYTPGAPRFVAMTRVRASSNGATANTANALLPAPASAGASVSSTPHRATNRSSA